MRRSCPPEAEPEHAVVVEGLERAAQGFPFQPDRHRLADAHRRRYGSARRPSAVKPTPAPARQERRRARPGHRRGAPFAASEVAGNSDAHGYAARLTPIPITTQSGSRRRGPGFEQDSGDLAAVQQDVVGPFGVRLGRTSRPAPRRWRARRQPSPAVSRSGRAGRNRIEQYRLPGGEIRRAAAPPPPAAWVSAQTTVPSGAGEPARAASASPPRWCCRRKPGRRGKKPSGKGPPLIRKSRLGRPGRAGSAPD